MESILGIQASRLVPSADITVVNGGVRAGLVCRWPGEELNQPAPRYWLGNLCHGHLPDALGLVCTQEREQKDTTPCSLEVGGKSALLKQRWSRLIPGFRFTAGSVALWLS